MVVGSWKLLTDELNEREQAIVVCVFVFFVFFGVGALSRNGDGGRGEREKWLISVRNLI